MSAQAPLRGFIEAVGTSGLGGGNATVYMENDSVRSTDAVKAGKDCPQREDRTRARHSLDHEAVEQWRRMYESMYVAHYPVTDKSA